MNQDDWALCVGIGSYAPGSRLEPLPGAVNDAKAIHAWLVDPKRGAVPEAQAQLVISPPQPDTIPSPQAHQIEQFFIMLHRRASESSQRGDGYRVGRRLWLFFAGHGIGFDNDEGEVGLLAADAQPRAWLPHLAAMAWARPFKRASAFDEIVLLMDCCRTRHFVPRRPPPLNPGSVEPGAKLLFAFAAVEGRSAYSVEVDGTWRGRFSLALQNLLESPGPQGLTARNFVDRLDRDYGGLPDCQMDGGTDPRLSRGDFQLLPPPPGPIPTPDAHLESHHPDGALAVRASDSVARLRVWDQSGRLRHEGYGTLELEQLRPGPYHVRAALGSVSSQADVEVEPSERAEVVLELDLATPSPEHLTKLDPLEDLPDGEFVELELRNQTKLALCLPRVAGWRAEVFDYPGRSGFDVRLVPEQQPAGQAQASDRVREATRLALSTPGWGAGGASVEELAGDPIAALLTAALRARNKLDVAPYLDAAAAVLGEHNVDVRLLRGEPAEVDVPPLLSLSWHLALRDDRLSVTANSLADQVSGRMYVTPPWFTQSTDKAEPQWLTHVANVVWPGWDGDEPNPELAAMSLDAVSKDLGVPGPSARRHPYKSPPLDRLVSHRRIVFVGASNDQLPAALVIAFAERNRQKWERIEVWSLDDDPLAAMISAARTGDQLIHARDRAEAQLRTLLPAVAEAWSIRRYPGLSIDDTRTFASLWDWTERGGFVHASPWTSGQDVRTTAATHETWLKDSAPPRFTRVVEAYNELVAHADTA